ncbi:MAG: hypothetical protein HWE16_10825 [Gammaproteobacteria bacterium]|nr:hypothetical protein [Gammaproteobacteria bacterium]
MNFKKTLIWLSLLIATSLLFTAALKANDETLQKAQEALANDQLDVAEGLFSQLTTTQEYQTQGLFGLAKVALNTKRLDDAEDYIEQVLKHSSNDPEHYFMAGRIAGEQARQANIFSQLGYARDTKGYFEQALKIDPKHQASIIGLIRFHQQAPVMAGGEKESIPALIEQLRVVNKKLAFSFESQRLIDKGDLQLLEQRYQAALKEQSSANNEQFKYDYAMLLSNNRHYSKALDTILSIDMQNEEAISEFSAMRYYQVAKLAAESRRELELGIASIQHYAQLSAENKTIPADWVNFRLAQLQLLKGDKAVSLNTLKTLKSDTDDRSLKSKISSLLEEMAH